MKLTTILLTLILVCNLGLTQSKKELQEQINKLNTEQKNLKEDIEVLKKRLSDVLNELNQLKEENAKLKSSTTSTEQTATTSSSTGHCQAKTAKGTQCTRKADSGSNYCWQHKNTNDPTINSSKSNSTSSSSSSSSSSYSNSHTIHTGPRGGQYYINSKGKKTYIKKK